MKSLIKFLMALFCLGFTFVSYSQTTLNYKSNELIMIDGFELFNFSDMRVIKSDYVDNFLPVQGDLFNYNYNLISTYRKTGYDHQSNATPQQVWMDLNNPSFIHSVFTYSSVADGQWVDRTSLYFGSTDAGVTWYELGPVPINIGGIGRSGFPAISGTSTGKAVIANHNNSFNTQTRTKIYYDNSPFEYLFTEFDPLIPTGGLSVWPRIVVLANNSSVFASSVNLSGTGFYTNTLTNGVFSGWQLHDGDQAETYSLSVSNGGKVGLAYLGQMTDDGDVYYKESTDGGLFWSTPLKIWDAVEDPVSGDFFGCLRGICLSFYNEQPCVVFELAWMNTAGTYYPGRESEIRFWQPEINSGFPIVLADTSNVPFYPSKGTNDVFVPLCRPVIGRSQNSSFLFVAFNATSGDYWPGSSSLDSTSYFAGYFMLSGNGGETWTSPEKFTPENPLRDWRYISMAQINHVENDICTVHMVVQVDSVPGSNINAAPPMPVSVTAQYFHVSTDLVIVPVELTTFMAELEKEKVILKWQTATETNNQGFEILRFAQNDNFGWQSIGFVEGKGTTTEMQRYTFQDKPEPGKYKYKLKQFDYDGTFEYSQEIEAEVKSPLSFSLEQNYPNPFNPSTVISYKLPVNSKVTLKVYEILGNEIATLVNEEQEAGKYEVDFDATLFPSGVYFYKLKTGEFIETKKMILLK